MVPVVLPLAIYIVALRDSGSTTRHIRVNRIREAVHIFDLTYQLAGPMTPGLPAMEAIREAAKRLAGIALRTPLVRLDVPAAPAEIWLKLENLQPIGSFKIRGAANAMAHIPPAELARGVADRIGRQHGAGRRLVRAQRVAFPARSSRRTRRRSRSLSAIERLGGARHPGALRALVADIPGPRLPGRRCHVHPRVRRSARHGGQRNDRARDPRGPAGRRCGRDSVGRRRPRQRDRRGRTRTGAELSRLCGRSGNGRAAGGGARCRCAADRRLPPVVRRRHRQPLGISADARTRTDARRRLARFDARRKLPRRCGCSPSAPASSPRAPAPAASPPRSSGRAGGGKIVCIVSGGNIDLGPASASLLGSEPALRDDGRMR